MATPEIRFTSEQDDWKLIDLEQNATYSKGRGYSKNDVVKTGTPVVLYGRLYTNFELEIDQVDTFVRPVQDSVISSGNEVVVPASGETPEDIARASAIIRPGLILGSDLNIIRPNAKLNPTFLASSLTYGVACKDLMSRAQGNVIVHLKNDDIRSLTVSTPSLAEQTKINSFFRHIDNQINDLKNSAKQLKNLKQTMLVKMFPQDRASVPEIRLEGFTGDWKMKTIENIAAKTLGGGTPATSHAEYWNGNIPWIQSSDLSGDSIENPTVRKWVSEIGIKNSATILIPENSIAVVTRVGVGKVSMMLEPYATSQDFISLVDIKGDLRFITIAVKQTVQASLSQLQGSTIKGITRDELISKKLRVPSTEEQAAIGSYFRQLDQLIELQEAKLTKLTQLKTAFLAKMFV